MPPRKSSALVDAASAIAAAGASSSAAAAAAPRTRSRTPTKNKKTAAPLPPSSARSVTMTQLMQTTTGSIAPKQPVGRSDGDTYVGDAGTSLSRASSLASIPGGQLITPAVSAPPTPSMHLSSSTSTSVGLRSATSAVAASSTSSASVRRAESASVPSQNPQLRAIHDAILRCDDYADLSVLSPGGSMAAGSTMTSAATVRRAFPTTSAFASSKSIAAHLRSAAASGRVTGLYNRHVDVGAGIVHDPICTPLYPKNDVNPEGTNDTGCRHCTHTTHCDCEYVADVFYDVFDTQLTQKRIIERSSSSAAAGGSRSRSQTADAAAAGRGGSSSASSSVNSSILSSLDDERSNSYGAAPAALSSVAVTSKTTVGSATRHLCAKSLLPPFVARLIRLMDIQPGDSFYDLGCGNGSILFQVALSAGATCVGVELCPHNAQLARDAWSLIKPIFDAKLQSAYNAGDAASTTRRRSSAAASINNAPNVGVPHVEIITGDIANVITDPAFTSRPRKILLSNLLFPKELTLFIAQQCRKLPKGSMIVCFDDLYPHGRNLCKIRDPEAFELFEMTDYKWPPSSVEWCNQEGLFYVHTKKK